MARIRANAHRCATLVRLVGYLDDPDCALPDVRLAIIYHVTLAHPRCPGKGEAAREDRKTTCPVTAAGGYLHCHLPAGHDGQHESRVIIWG